MCGDRVISVSLGQYHGFWCPGSLRHQDIRSHDIDYIKYVGPYLVSGRILSTCVISMWRNDIKCKDMFMFTLKNLGRKGLIVQSIMWAHIITLHMQIFQWTMIIMSYKERSTYPFKFLKVLLCNGWKLWATIILMMWIQKSIHKPNPHNTTHGWQ